MCAANATEGIDILPALKDRDSYSGFGRHTPDLALVGSCPEGSNCTLSYLTGVTSPVPPGSAAVPAAVLNARARMFLAALWSAFWAWPQATQAKPACVVRFSAAQ